MSDNETSADVLIIGGGPAGMSSAVWCAELGMATLLVEESRELGGQLLNIYNPIRNYPGVTAVNGREVRDRFQETITTLTGSRLLGERVERLDCSQKVAVTASGLTVGARRIILATGVRRRRLGIEGEERFAGEGVMESGALERETAQRKRVVVVGGGDAALENALMLAEYASRVTVVHRGKEFKARPEFVKEVTAHPKIDFRFQTSLLEIGGTNEVGSVVLSNSNSGRVDSVETDLVLIRIGVEPNSDLVRGQLDLDTAGYVLVDRRCRTSSPDVYSVGDVANPAAPTISSASGDGATAAKSLLSELSA